MSNEVCDTDTSENDISEGVEIDLNPILPLTVESNWKELNRLNPDHRLELNSGKVLVKRLTSTISGSSKRIIMINVYQKTSLVILFPSCDLQVQMMHV